METQFQFYRFIQAVGMLLYTAAWGINETCPVTVEILFEQKSAIFDDICPYKSMSIVSHKQWDHMIDKLNYFGSPKFF